jgi:hypothetical protein
VKYKEKQLKKYIEISRGKDMERESIAKEKKQIHFASHNFLLCKTKNKNSQYIEYYMKCIVNLLKLYIILYIPRKFNKSD